MRTSIARFQAAESRNAAEADTPCFQKVAWRAGFFFGLEIFRGFFADVSPFSRSKNDCAIVSYFHTPICVSKNARFYWCLLTVLKSASHISDHTALQVICNQLERAMGIEPTFPFRKAELRNHLQNQHIKTLLT
jgi:hypothetical protein